MEALKETDNSVPTVCTFPVILQPGAKLLDVESQEIIEVNVEANINVSSGTVVYIGETSYAVGDKTTVNKSTILFESRPVQLLTDTPVILKANTPLCQIQDDIIFTLNTDKVAVLKSDSTPKVNLPNENTSKKIGFIATFDAFTLTFRSIDTFKAIRTITLKEKINDCVFSPDQKRIAIRHASYRIEVFNTADFKSLDVYYTCEDYVEHFGFLDDDTIFIKCGKKTNIYNIMDKSRIDELKFLFNVRDMHVHQNLIYYLASDIFGHMRYIFVQDMMGSILTRVCLHLDVCSIYVWSKKTIILGFYDGTLRTINMQTNLISKPVAVSKSPIIKIEVANGKIICRSYAVIIVVDTRDFTQYQEFDRHPVSIIDHA